MPVNTPSAAYTAARSRWDRCADCYEGEDAIKNASVLYLPLLDGHKGASDQRYLAYLKRALFYNAFGRTVEGLSGAILQKDPALITTKDIETQLNDITLTSVSFWTFALRVAMEVLKVGRYGVLVDMPSDPNASDLRPYWVGYDARNILSVRARRISGRLVLTQVVLDEWDERPKADDPWTMERFERVRVLQLDARGIYVQFLYSPVKDKPTEWTLTETITPTRNAKPLTFIPFTFFGPFDLSPSIVKPPLVDLASMNLSHYRTMADLEHGRYWTSIPQPWVSGVDDKTALVMGSGVAWGLPQGCEAGMLEFSGQGLQSLETAEKEKRAMMATLGARLIEGQSPNETALAVQMRHAGEHASLRSIAGAVGDGLTQCLQYHEWWDSMIDLPANTRSTITLQTDFFATRMTSQDVQALVQAWQAGGISFQTFYDNLARGDWTRKGVDAATERRAITADGGPAPEPEPIDDDDVH
jgi:hypothetical protein